MSDPSLSKPKPPTNPRPERKNRPPEAEPAPEKLWKTRGLDDVFYQRQAQTTWWTVLGGISVAALLTQLEPLLAGMKAGQWHYALYFLASCLIVINSWVQTAWGGLVLRWPISIPTSVSIFFQGLSMSVAALNITRPAIWYAAVTIVILSAVFNQLVFMKRGGWITIPPAMIARSRTGIVVYLALEALTIAACVHLSLRPTFTAELAWGAVAFLAAVFALAWQQLGMMEEKRLMGVP